MQVSVMTHSARDPVREINWIGTNRFDFVDFFWGAQAADQDGVDPGAAMAFA